MSDQALRETIIERIRKLMAFKTGGSTEGEIENALDKARKLMDKYNIEEHTVLASADEAAKASAHKAAYDSIVEEEIYSRAGKIDPFDIDLAHVPCKICDVKMYLRQSTYTLKGENNNEKWGRKNSYKPMDRQFIVFYGFPKDVGAASAMYMELLTTMRSMLQFRYPKDWRDMLGSYCSGFVDRLRQRANELHRQSAQTPSEPGCTAIVLAKDSIIERWARDRYSFGAARARRVNVKDGGAYSAGSQDGSRVHLGRSPQRSIGREPRQLR